MYEHTVCVVYTATIFDLILIQLVQLCARALQSSVYLRALFGRTVGADCLYNIFWCSARLYIYLLYAY